MSLHKFVSLIDEVVGVGENPDPFFKSVISGAGKVFWLKLRTETYDSLILSSTNLLLALQLPHNVSIRK